MNENINDWYRHVLKQEAGRKILGDLLTKLHFGVTLDPENAAQIAEYNVGILILAKSGILDEVKTMLGMQLNQ